MTRRPTTHMVLEPKFRPESFDNHIVRTLSAMKGQFHDERAYAELIAAGDPLLYEVYEFAADELPEKGMMVMETPEGETDVRELRAGSVLYVPPRWAHRSVNTEKSEDLVTFFSYPAHAGHDYGTIESRGFRKIVVERGGFPVVIENPSWRNER